ncbi:MAG: hypothetical protein EX270_08925 [Pseudomonadales bacterium]|nr:MAG: hypothetical protein EX270_08925 [Pseudomonadales bacterium]
MKAFSLVAGMALLTLFGMPIDVMAQEASTTLHRWDYLDLVSAILAVMGAGGALAAYVPLKVQKWIPGLRAVLNIVGSNVRNAKNAID